LDDVGHGVHIQICIAIGARIPKLLVVCVAVFVIGETWFDMGKCVLFGLVAEKTEVDAAVLGQLIRVPTEFDALQTLFAQQILEVIGRSLRQVAEPQPLDSEAAAQLAVEVFVTFPVGGDAV